MLDARALASLAREGGMPEEGDPLARVFVGSAGKSRDLACRVAQQPKQQAQDLRPPVRIEATSWEYTFQSGDITYDRLLECVRDYEFGVFVFTADDDAVIDGKDTKLTRDNVIFELGLWAGAHGRDHAHVLKAAGEQMRLLTDLDGYVTQSFEHGSDQSLDDACGKTLKKIIQLARRNERRAPQSWTHEQTHPAESVLRQQLDAGFAPARLRWAARRT